MTDLTLNEAVAAIREAAKSSDDGFATLVEIARRAGIHPATARKQLKLLLLDGRLAVGRVVRSALDGRSFPVPAYKIKRKK